MVNIQPSDQAQQPISDDQELAKVLAGVDMQTPEEEEVITTTTITNPAPPLPPVPPAEPEELLPPAPEEPPVVSVNSGSGDLTSVKQEALSELRPLVDKLNVPAEEKFDTYLLLLRSTDDKSLIEPAHETAKLIEDEARRAQALLDIIKEIDFLSQAK